MSIMALNCGVCITPFLVLRDLDIIFAEVILGIINGKRNRGL